MDCIIEIPAFTSTKYEMDKTYNMIRFDRMLNTAMVYPGNYGYIPYTLGGDGDPLDIIMPVSYPLYPTSLVKVKIVGVILMEDEAGMDEKIIVYPDDKVDQNYQNINKLSDVPKETLDQIIHFFEHYKDLSKGKFVKIKGVADKNEAMKIIKEAQHNYINYNKSTRKTTRKTTEKTTKKNKN
jgi:inorganic pyrophosphatase